jgi:hypothetical protein
MKKQVKHVSVFLKDADDEEEEEEDEKENGVEEVLGRGARNAVITSKTRVCTIQQIRNKGFQNE